jgi:chorismate mutase
MMNCDTPLPQYIDLEDLRQSIDLLDSSLMFLLAERTRLVIKAGLVKKHYHLPVFYTEGRKKDLDSIINTAVKEGIPLEFMNQIYNRVFSEVVKIIDGLPDNPEIFAVSEGEIDYHMLLNDLQKSLYNIDISLVRVLVERFRIVTKVGGYKKIHSIKPLASKRWQHVLESKVHMARKLNIKEDFIKDIFNLIHEHALSIES